MNRDIPTIRDAGHAHTIYGLGNLGSATNVAGTTSMQLGGINQLATNTGTWAGDLGTLQHQGLQLAAHPAVQTKKEKPMAEKPKRRFVQVFIADTDDNIPLDMSMLYTGEPKLTDATDQELYFEIDLKALLVAHNEKRVKLVNKKVKERTENLEPARIRDLQMVVVNIASFG